MWSQTLYSFIYLFKHIYIYILYTNINRQKYQYTYIYVYTHATKYSNFRILVGKNYVFKGRFGFGPWCRLPPGPPSDWCASDDLVTFFRFVAGFFEPEKAAKDDRKSGSVSAFHQCGYGGVRVSINGGTPKSSVWRGFSTGNHVFRVLSHKINCNWEKTQFMRTKR